jgi:hypothetical protein
MVVCLKHVGITESARERLKMSAKTLASWSAHALSTRPGNQSVQVSCGESVILYTIMLFCCDCPLSSSDFCHCYHGFTYRTDAPSQ